MTFTNLDRFTYRNIVHTHDTIFLSDQERKVFFYVLTHCAVGKNGKDISSEDLKFKARIVRTAHLRAKAAKNKEIKLRVSLRRAPLISNTPEFDFSVSPYQADPTKWSVNFAFPRQFGSRWRTTVDLPDP